MFSTLQSASFNPKLDGTSSKLDMDDVSSGTESSLFASELEAVESNIENNGRSESNSRLSRLESVSKANRFEAEAKVQRETAKLHENTDAEASKPTGDELTLLTDTSSKASDNSNMLAAESPDNQEGTDFYSFLTASVGTNTHVKNIKRESIDTSSISSAESKLVSEASSDTALFKAAGELEQSQLSINEIIQTKKQNAELEQIKGLVSSPKELEQLANQNAFGSRAGEVTKQHISDVDEQREAVKSILINNADASEKQLSSKSAEQSEVVKNNLLNNADEDKRQLSSKVDEQSQLAKNVLIKSLDEAHKQRTNEPEQQKQAIESNSKPSPGQLDDNNSRKDAQLFLDKAMANVSGDVEKSAIAKAVAEQLEKTQVQSNEALSVKDVIASLKSENDNSLGKDTLASLDIGKKEVPGKEVVSDTKSMTQGFDLASSVKNASPSMKGIGVNVAVLETELNQLSMAQREALQIDLKDKLTQGTLTPAEQKVLKSVLTALQLSGDDKISLEVKQFVSAKAQDQEVKLSQASALPNDNAKLVDSMAKADVQGSIKGLNESVEMVGKGTKASVNPAEAEQVELKLGSSDAIEQRQTGASDPVNSKKSDDKTESLVTVPLAKKSEDLVDQGVDSLEPASEQEQEALIDSQNTTQQQAKMSDNSASLQRIMQTVTQIAQTNAQFDNAVNGQVFQQIEQVQQQQHSVAHAQKVVMDPAMLEAINIARHDAVKELQNRVSMMLNLNNKEAEIRLDPPELGSLQIRIRTDAETAQVNFVVQNQQAKELLEQSLPKLREMLAEQGINLGESSIEHGSSGHGNTGEESRKGINSRVDSDQVEEGAAENLSTTAKTSSSAIDYYA